MGKAESRGASWQAPRDASGVRTASMQSKGSMRTRESRRVQAKACRVRQATSENGPMTRRQSAWLIVLRGWESQPHGEAASERWIVRRQHGLHAMGDWAIYAKR